MILCDNTTKFSYWRIHNRMRPKKWEIALFRFTKSFKCLLVLSTLTVENQTCGPQRTRSWTKRVHLNSTDFEGSYVFHIYQFSWIRRCTLLDFLIYISKYCKQVELCWGMRNEIRINYIRNSITVSSMLTMEVDISCCSHYKSRTKCGIQVYSTSIRFNVFELKLVNTVDKRKYITNKTITF